MKIKYDVSCDKFCVVNGNNEVITLPKCSFYHDRHVLVSRLSSVGIFEHKKTGQLVTLDIKNQLKEV